MYQFFRRVEIRGKPKGEKQINQRGKSEGKIEEEIQRGKSNEEVKGENQKGRTRQT